MIPPQSGPCLPLELSSSPVIVLGRLGFEIKRRAIEELEAAGSSLYDYSVLALLAEGASETQASIADTLNLDRSQLVGLLDGLEKRGLIERVKQIEDHFLEPLDAEERYQLYRLLFRVAAFHDTRFVRPAEAVAA